MPTGGPTGGPTGRSMGRPVGIPAGLAVGPDGQARGPAHGTARGQKMCSWAGPWTRPWAPTNRSTGVYGPACGRAHGPVREVLWASLWVGPRPESMFAGSRLGTPVGLHGSAHGQKFCARGLIPGRAYGPPHDGVYGPWAGPRPESLSSWAYPKRRSWTPMGRPMKESTVHGSRPTSSKFVFMPTFLDTPVGVQG